MNNLFLLSITFCGTFWYHLNLLIERCFNYSTLKVFLNDIKRIYFVDLSSTIMNELYNIYIIKFFDFNNLMIKSVMIFFHGISNNFITCVLPYMLYIECLIFWCYIYFVMYSISWCFILKKQYFLKDFCYYNNFWMSIQQIFMMLFDTFFNFVIQNNISLVFIHVFDWNPIVF